MLTYIAVWAALTVLWHGIKLVLGIPRLAAVNTAATALINIFLPMLFWRRLTAPLVRRFGARANDVTHRSARFASRSETARLTQSIGLLIGFISRTPKKFRRKTSQPIFPANEILSDTVFRACFPRWKRTDFDQRHANACRHCIQ